MDLRLQTSLMAALVALALGGNVMLRARNRREHWLFGLFGLSVGLWYLSTFAAKLTGSTILARLNLAFGLLVPLFAVQFFRFFLAEDNRWMQRLFRAALIIGAAILASLTTPLYENFVVRTALLLYVVVFLFASLVMLYRRAQHATSKFEGARVRFLALVGGLAGFFALFEYLPYVGLDLPPVGTVLVLVFLYMLSQSIVRYRLIDLYELAGRLGVLTVLSFALAGVLWLLTFTGGRYFLHAVVASLIVLVIGDPLRAKVSQQILQILFRERYDLEKHIQSLRRDTAHVFEINELTRVLMEGLEQSHRITHASLFLLEEDRRAFEIAGFVGPEPVARLELAPARPLLERLELGAPLVRDNVERELDEHREGGGDREAETLYEISQTMEAMQSSVCLAVRGEEGDLYGILSVGDERMRDAFSPEEVLLLQGLANQAAIALENSLLYKRLKERDRLATLGEMAAGLAHEIRNPLGAIKASAQYLTEGQDESDSEFLDIIVEEVDRLDRVVGSFLNYAKPGRGNPRPTDVNAAVERTMQLLLPECQARDTEVSVGLEDALPLVQIDAEHLRQVLINLVQNSLQALEKGGEIQVSTRSPEPVPTLSPRAPRRTVELHVTDNGPGISDDVRENLFVPFVTTKQRGTGLGLAISQRIVSDAGGRIDVRSSRGHGTTIVVRLPAAELQLESAPRAVTELLANSAQGSGKSTESRSEPELAGELPSSLTTSR